MQKKRRTMKIFPAELVKAIDQYTIANEPIASIDLMERAAMAVAAKIVELFPANPELAVFAGSGNNGGDGLAVARLLAQQGYRVQAYFIQTTPTTTPDTAINLSRLAPSEHLAIETLTPEAVIPYITPETMVVDALFGSGVSRPLDGFNKHMVEFINDSGCPIISIDLPSGLMAEDNSGNEPDGIIRADYTITLELPKLALLLPENDQYVGELSIVPIGLHPKALDGFPSSMHFVTNEMAAKMLYKRRKFAHKGTFGHCYLIAGSQKMLGASILSSRACMKTGTGLLTTHIPAGLQAALNIAAPEVIIDLDSSPEYFSTYSSITSFDAIGVGPGLGANATTVATLAQLLADARRMPMVIDADGLNAIAYNKELLKVLPKFAILTPHPKEFERLAGSWNNDLEKLQLLNRFAKEHSAYIVLKGAHTTVASPDGRLWFASVGNPGMATAGSGDVLTGIILSLLGQGYSPEEASILGVHLHGLAGDIAAREESQEALIASSIVGCIGKAFKFLWEIRNS
jgi:ADP-dependent NAD(P)H-hydrate dehydratase / NAD(P)H-hydrate epimerase